MKLDERKKNFYKINLITILFFILFFGLLLLPNNVLASDCCEISATTVGVNGSSSQSNYCKDDADVNKETCINKTSNNLNSTINQSAVFFENSVCNQEKTKCEVVSTTPTTVKKIELKPINFKFNIPLPGMPESFQIGVINPGSLATYLDWLYKFIIGIAGLLAVFMITIGGLMWIFAGGNGSKIGKSREYIFGAIIGLLLAIFSYSILYIINPQLVLNKFPTLNPVDVAGIDGFTGNPDDLQIGRKGIDCFYKEFGASPDEVSKNLVTVDCPFLRQGKVTVHKKVADAFKQACNKIPKGTTTVCGTIPIMSQSYMWRNMASGGRSYHSFGVALDISTQDCTSFAESMGVPKGWYKNGNIPRDFTPAAKGYPNLPRFVIDAFKSAGFNWGGDWPASNPVDNMHFETYGPCRGATKKVNNGSGSGGSGGQCSGPIMSITSGKPINTPIIINDPKDPNIKNWEINKASSHVYIYPKNNQSNTKDLVIYFHGWLSGNFYSANCNVALGEIAETSAERFALACIHGAGGENTQNPWTGTTSAMEKYVNDSINNFTNKIGRSPGKVIVAGHSGAWDVMNKLIGSSVDSKINKFIWLDACYANPKGSSKVIGIEVTTTAKSNAPCKCSSIENRYDKPGVGHFDAIKYLSDYLKKL